MAKTSSGLLNLMPGFLYPSFNKLLNQNFETIDSAIANAQFNYRGTLTEYAEDTQVGVYSLTEDTKWNELLPNPGVDANGSYLVIFSNGSAPNAFMYTTEGTYNTFIPSTKKWKLNVNHLKEAATLEEKDNTIMGDPNTKVFKGGLYFCQIANEKNVFFFPNTFDVSYNNLKKTNIFVTQFRSLKNPVLLFVLQKAEKTLIPLKSLQGFIFIMALERL